MAIRLFWLSTAWQSHTISSVIASKASVELNVSNKLELAQLLTRVKVSPTSKMRAFLRFPRIANFSKSSLYFNGLNFLSVGLMTT